MSKRTVVEDLQQLEFDDDVTMGCDPEFFFTDKRGKVVGSEKVLPPEGVKVSGIWNEFGEDDYDEKTGEGKTPHFIIDGVQAELNPPPNTCRALLGNDIHHCFRNLATRLKKEGRQLDVDFKPLVKITKKELDSLSEASKRFGCAPSTNIYKSAKEAKIKVDPKKYLKRSAGGHIHLGANTGGWKGNTMKKTLHKPKVLVPILDLVVANTCVLIDRDPSNVERRKNYGRVGEYRIKKYGIEYRTLSNFWLRSYQLMSFVMGMARMACQLADQSTKSNNYVKALMDAVPREDVIKAVQENDFDLAYANFTKIEPIILAAAGGDNYDYPLSKAYIDEFHYFVKKGMDAFFDKNAFNHWINLHEGHGRGWESFCKNHVRKAMGGKRVRAVATEAF